MSAGKGLDHSAGLPDLAKMLEQLIGHCSISSANPQLDHSNKPVVDLLAGWLTGLGFQVELLPVPKHPGKFNLIAILGSGPGGLVLSGHTDTVPFDAGRWSQDPFKLAERDGRFYGLGTCDMKGFFAIALEAIRGLGSFQPVQPLIVLATADEESSMAGARALAAQGFPKARYALIGEPTDLKPMRLHKGVMMESLKVTGHSGHSSDPSLGHNALDAMHAMMGALMALRGELAVSHHNPHFRVAQPTMNFGCIHGGDASNRICGACELQFDLRLLPGMDNEELRQMIQARIDPIAHAHQVQAELRPLFEGVPSFEESADSELVRVCEKLSGHTAGSVAFATEAPFLQRLGMQTLVMGPGSIDQAHQPDEYLEQSQIRPAVNIIQGLIQRFCLQQG